MQERRALRRFPAVRNVLIAAGIAVVIGSGFFIWLRHRMTQPAMPAVLLFDADTARQAEPWVMKAKEPAVAFARSILSGDEGGALAEQASVSFAGETRTVAEIRSHLQMAQPSAKLLEVRYLNDDEESSAAANAVVKMLAAWSPAVATSPSVVTPQPDPVKAQPHRREAVGDSPSEAELAFEAQLAVVDQKLASLGTSNNPSPQPAGTAEDYESQLRAKRGELTQAIAVEKRREAIGREHAAAEADDSTAASPTQPGSTPVQDASGGSSSPAAVPKHSFAVVGLAKDAVPPVRDNGLLLYAVPAGLLCGLLYLGGATWRFRSIQSETVPALVAEETAESADTKDVPVSAASAGLGVEETLHFEETPVNGVVNNDPDAEEEDDFPQLMEKLMRGGLSFDMDASHPADNSVEAEDSWAEDVKRVLAQASFGGEEDVPGARHAVHLAGGNGLGFKTSDRYADVLESVRENIKRDPNIWMAHTEEARAALAARDFDKAAEEMKLAIAVAPEELQARLGEIAAQMDRANMRGAAVTGSF
jgi:hypothetical protein